MVFGGRGPYLGGMAKTITFGIVHVSVAFGVGWALTGSMLVGGALALVEPLVNTVAYFFHEKLWQRFGSRGSAHGIMKA